MSANERPNVSSIADMRYHQSKSLGADSLAPIRLAYPTAHRRLSVQSRERTVTRRTVAYGSYCLAVSFHTIAHVVGLRNTVRIISKLSLNSPPQKDAEPILPAIQPLGHLHTYTKPWRLFQAKDEG